MFNPECRQCPRVAAFLGGIGQDYPEYHAGHVAPFGSKLARLFMSPGGMHGASGTGRPFTGDYAGVLLYKTHQ